MVILRCEDPRRASPNLRLESREKLAVGNVAQRLLGHVGGGLGLGQARGPEHLVAHTQLCREVTLQRQICVSASAAHACVTPTRGA